MPERFASCVASATPPPSRSVDLAARERARFARYTAPAGAGGGARELRTLGAADVTAAWDFIRSMPFAVTVHTAPHRPMYARDVDERRLDVLGATGRLTASYATGGDLPRIDGLLVVARRSSHSSPSCLDLAFLDAPPTLLAGLARAARDLAAARGAATVAVALRVTDDRVDALRTAGWSWANPASGCSILFERAIGACVDGGGTVTAGEGHSEQERLNALLGPFGYPPLRCDGVIGARTLQARSAARLLSEERTHRAAARWVLVDKAAQALLGGDRDGTVRFVFPATTGTPEHETREVTDVPAFRFEPATANAGWRNSTTFPVGSDDARWWQHVSADLLLCVDKRSTAPTECRPIPPPRGASA